MTFEEWLLRVDGIILSKTGLGYEDLADFNSRDLYDDGCTPEMGAEECLLGDDTYAMMVGTL